MKLISFILLSFIALATFGQSNPYIHSEPKDDASFLAFKKQLALAIEKKDTTLLKPLLGDSILESRNGLCKHCTNSTFLSINCIERKELPYSNDFWEQAKLLLELGFAKPTKRNPDYYSFLVKGGKHLISPPYNYHNNYDTVLVLDTNVEVHKEPFKDAVIISLLSFEPIPTVNDNTSDDLYSFYIYNQDEETGYIKIKLKNRSTGYINASKTSQSITKQITIAKQKGQWKIVSFYHPPGC